MLREELHRFVDQIEAHEPAEAAAWAEARVEGGDADAQFLMGLLLIHAPRSNFRDACAWYERAAAQDHAEALYELSRIDQSEARANWGPPISDRMRRQLVRAGELGSVRACAKLGEFHASGRGGFPKDERAAEVWHRKAADADDVDAEMGLAALFLWKTDAATTVNEGILWLERAASKERSERLWEGYQASQALERLVEIYEQGFRGIAADPAKAAASRERLGAYRSRLVEKREHLHTLAKGEGIDLTAPPIGATSTKEPAESRPHAYENVAEARTALRAHMAAFRSQTHRDLAGLVNKRLASRVAGSSGRSYDVVVEVRWDDQPLGDVHVAGTINDDGWRACEDMYEIFSMSSANEIVGDSF